MRANAVIVASYDTAYTGDNTETVGLESGNFVQGAASFCN